MRALVLFATTLLCARALAAEPNPYLLEAQRAHAALRYEQCEELLSRAGRWPSPPRELAQIEMYEGLCQFNLGRADAAQTHFELGLRMDPDLQLPPLTSPKIQKVWDAVVRRMPKAVVPTPPEPARASDAPRVENSFDLVPARAAPSAQESTQVKAPASRHLAAPTWVLGSLAVASLANGVVFGVLARASEKRANASPYRAEVLSVGATAVREATVANVSYAVAVGTAVAAVVSYLLSGSPPDVRSE